MKRTESAEKNLRSKRLSANRATRAKFLVCVRNDEYPVALERGKIYRGLPDDEACNQGMVRIVDESGEDYLFPARFFLPIALSRTIRQALSRAS